MKAKKKGNSQRYKIFGASCLGCECFNPGMYQHRGASGGGSKNSGQSAVCLTNAYHGCPIVPKFSPELMKQRKDAGWSKS